MPSTVLNKKEREKKGLPEIKFSRRGSMYTTPKEIISSKAGKNLLKSLSDLDSNIDVFVEVDEKQDSIFFEVIEAKNFESLHVDILGFIDKLKPLSINIGGISINTEESKLSTKDRAKEILEALKLSKKIETSSKEEKENT